jgi:type VI secretion system protein ImpC
VEGGDILDSILSGGAGGELPQARPASTAAAPPAPAARDSEWKSLIRNIVAPHLVPHADPRQGELLAQLDEAVAAQMRLTLHDPAFQSLEAAWRSVFLLLDRLETGVDLKIDLIDLSKAELLADLDVEPDALEETGLHRILVDETAALPGAVGYSVVACLDSFGESPQEVRALASAARIAARAGSALIVGGAPQLLGRRALDRADEPRRWTFQAEDPALEAAWLSLRESPDAEWLAVAAPRFLLRTPYGEDGSSTDLPGFEELDDTPPHDLFLWGPPSAACACLLGEAFMRSGWSLRPGALGLLDKRPVWHAGKGADREMVPGAEVWMTDEAVEEFLGRGLSPLVSIKGRDAIAVARLQSVAAPARALRGPWDSA